MSVGGGQRAFVCVVGRASRSMMGGQGFPIMCGGQGFHIRWVVTVLSRWVRWVATIPPSDGLQPYLTLEQQFVMNLQDELAAVL